MVSNETTMFVATEIPKIFPFTFTQQAEESFKERRFLILYQSLNYYIFCTR